MKRGTGKETCLVAKYVMDLQMAGTLKHSSTLDAVQFMLNIGVAEYFIAANETKDTIIRLRQLVTLSILLHQIKLPQGLVESQSETKPENL